MYDEFNDQQLINEKLVYLKKIEDCKDEIIKINDIQNRRLKEDEIRNNTSK